MSERHTSIQTRSRAEVQELVRSKSRSPTLRRSVSARIRDGDTDQYDLRQCLSSGVVTDVGCFEDGILATVLGHDTRGLDLVAVVYISDDETDPLLIEDFVASWSLQR